MSVSVSVGVSVGGALASGLVAGLGIAVPLGAIGVLVVQEGALRGVRRALPGAAAVASVDALSCVLALLVGGAAAPRIAQWRPWPAVVGGGVLLVVAGVGLHRGRAGRPVAEPPDEAVTRRLWRRIEASAPVRVARGGAIRPAEARGRAIRPAEARGRVIRPAEAPGGSTSRAGAARLRHRTVPSPRAGWRAGWRRYALFFGLTAVNPLTLVYFAALVSGLAGLTGDVAAATAFVVGVGAASFGWQALLVVVGRVLGGRAGRSTRRATLVVGNVVVAALGVATLWRALRP